MEQPVDPAEIPVKFPAVAICYMAPEVGCGLFALEDIKGGDVIAEYTGKHIKKPGVVNENGVYVVRLYKQGEMSYEVVDAEKSGNVARFAQHFPTDKEFSECGYKIHGDSFINNAAINLGLIEADVALSNSGTVMMGDDTIRLSVLVAIKNIGAFEQIGWSYGMEYGWPNGLKLFNKKGEIISQDKFQIRNFGFLISDQIGTMAGFENIKKLFAPPVNSKGQVRKDFHDLGDFVSFEGSGYVSLVDSEIFEQQMLKEQCQASMPGYILNNDTDIDKFMSVLRAVNKLEIGKKDKGKILIAARDNKHVEVEELLDLVEKGGSIAEPEKVEVEEESLDVVEEDDKVAELEKAEASYEFEDDMYDVELVDGLIRVSRKISDIGAFEKKELEKSGILPLLTLESEAKVSSPR